MECLSVLLNISSKGQKDKTIIALFTYEGLLTSFAFHTHTKRFINVISVSLAVAYDYTCD